MGHSFLSNDICVKCGCSRPAVEAFEWLCNDAPTSEKPRRQVGPISLRAYARLLEDINFPTDTQKENFADFVAHSHSWYKHLPLCPPGAMFHVFIHKYAAFDRVIRDDGRMVLLPSVKSGLHYSDLPTAEYHRRFGPLSYSRLSPALAWQNAAGESVTLRLPSQVLDCGAVRLTAAVHTLSAGFNYWHKLRPANRKWPEESGGLAAFEEICKRSEALQTGRAQREPVRLDEEYRSRCPDASDYSYGIDGVLHKLLLPERERQYREIRDAASSVCKAIEQERRMSKLGLSSTSSTQTDLTR